MESLMKPSQSSSSSLLLRQPTASMTRSGHQQHHHRHHNQQHQGQLVNIMKSWKIFSEGTHLQSVSPTMDHSSFLTCAGIFIISDLYIAWLSFMLYTGDKLSSSIFWCLALVTPDQISTFSNVYRHTSPLLTMYHLIASSTYLYWPSTSQYRHILTQYHQVPLIIHHLVRHSSVNWIISLFTTHLMSHAQYTWSSFFLCFPYSAALILSFMVLFYRARVQ